MTALQMAPRALVTVTIALSLLFILLVVVIWWTRRSFPGYSRWTVAGALLVVALCLLGLRPFAPDWVSTVGGNTLIVISSILYLEGSRQLLGLHPRNWLAYGAGGVAVFGVAYFEYIVPSLNARGAVMSLFIGIIYMATSIRLVQAIPPRRKFGMTLTSLMFALCATLHVARALYFRFAAPLDGSSVYSGISGALFVAILATMAGFGVGFILVADERAISDLEDAKDKAVHATMEIDERKQAEAVLRQSEARFRASEARLRDAQRLAKVGSFERDVETGTMYWSDEKLRIFGLQKAAPPNSTGFLKYVHAKDKEKVRQMLHNIGSTQEPIEVEYRITRPDGEVRVVRSIVEGIRNDKGALVRVVGASQDITEQVRAGELLKESEQRLLSAQRLAHVGSWHWDLETNQVSCGEECLRIFGYPPDYVPNYEGLLEKIITGDRERVASEIRTGIAEKSGCSTEFHIARPGGELRTVIFNSRVLLDEDGVPRHIFGACQDITDLRQAQDESFARQKLESVGTLANGIAHDFNNLLGGVLVQAELALSELAAGTDPEEELRAIREVAMRGSEIVRQLMVYAGKENESLAPVDVSEVVEEIRELLKVTVSKHATIETDLGRDLPVIRANPAQISQLVMNLVTNASEAIGNRPGKIGVTTRLVTSPQLARLEGLGGGDYLQLEVSDTGCGMSPETLARVFDPFFSTKAGGRGLGLAFVHGMVRGLGGAIHLTSEPGRGTTVQVWFPCAEATSATAGGLMPKAGDARPLSQAATVLFVEDEDHLRQAASKMLRKEGFSVIEAPDGSAALDTIRTQQKAIDVLFLDITLPGAPSREVFGEARRLRPEMKVIVTSAYNKEMAAASLQGGVDRFLRKPYRFGELTDLIRQALS